MAASLRSPDCGRCATASRVCHVSYFEADAYARGPARRLPTEPEWEVAARIRRPVEGNFAETLLDAGEAIHPRCAIAAVAITIQRIFGDVWEWTASPYAPYPGYATASRRLGRVQRQVHVQSVCVARRFVRDSLGPHSRPTYRNFFPPETRWQFSGFRLRRP